MLGRRGFVLSALAIGATPTLTWADAGDPAFLAAARKSSGAFVLCGLARDGSIVFRLC